MKRLKKAEDALSMLEQDLQGEYNAIDMYQKHIDAIDIPEIKKLLEHIKQEEEQHSRELTDLINKYMKK